MSGHTSEEAGFLKALVEEPGDVATRLAFADWLEERDDPRALWVRDPDLYRFATAAVQDPLPGLLVALGEPETHEAVWRGLTKLGERAAPAVLERMKTGDQAVREHARKVFGSLGLTAVGCLPELRRMLESGDTATMRAAAELLGVLGSAARPALPRLLELLEHADIGLRTEAAAAIGSMKNVPASALPKLRAALRPREGEEDGWEFEALRCQVIRAFGALGPAAMKVVPVLMGSFSSGGTTVYEITTVLVGLGPAAVGPMLDAAEAVENQLDALKDASQVFIEMGPVVIPQLVDALANPQRSHRAREISLRALVDEGMIKHLGVRGPTVVESLVEALKAPDGSFRREAVWGLHELGELARPAIPALREALSDGGLSETAARILARFGQGGTGVGTIIEHLRGDASSRRVAVRALESLGIGDGALPLLLEALQGPDEEVRREAARVFSEQIRPGWAEAVGPLTLALTDRSASVRQASAEALGKLGPLAGPAVPALIELSNEPNEWVRAKALSALAAIAPGSDELLSVIMPALADPSEWVRRRAALGLCEFAVLPEGTAAALEAMILGPDREVAYAIGWSIGESATLHPWAVRLARRVLRDGNSDLRRTIAEYLENKGPLAAELAADLLAALSDEDGLTGNSVASALAATGPVGQALLADCLTAPDEAVRERAVYGFASSRCGGFPIQFLPRLLAAIADPGPGVRRNIAAALSRAEPKSSEVVAPLVAFLTDENLNVRHQALVSLRDLGPLARNAFSHILPRLADEDSDCRCMAAQALARLDGPPQQIVPHLRRALHDFHDTVQSTAADALGEIGPLAREAVPDLRAIAANPTHPARDNAAAALKKIIPGEPG